MVNILAADAASLIDVGSHNAQYMEWFDWIGTRHSLDIRTPYASEAVTGIQCDFFAYEPPSKYDFALCLQVLEHVEDADRFACRLFDLSDRVIISVPHRWPRGACKSHVQDPVDADKVFGWTKRRPDYQVLVTEPLRKPRTAERLILYYGPPGKAFVLDEVREHAKTVRAERRAGQQHAD